MSHNDKSMQVEKTSMMSSAKGTDDHCARPNCHEALSRFSECSICSGPLQCFGPYACPRCGGVWCARCSRHMSKCTWCGETLRVPATPCLALQKLVNHLLLPCRNYRRGCPELLAANTRATHEEVCEFDTIKCPVDDMCRSLSLKDLSAHIQSTHNIVAVHSHEINIRMDNFQTVLKNISSRKKAERRIFLLHQKNAFIIKYCIFNSSRVMLQVMRKKLGYIADQSVPVKSKYCGMVQFQSKTFSTETAIRIRDNDFGKKASLNWNKFIKKSNETDYLTIHVKIEKSDS